MNKVNWQKISEFKKTEDSSGFLLWQVSCKWRRSIEQSLKEYCLTHPQFVILAVTSWLTKDNINISQVEIAKYSKIDIATTSQIIRALENKEYLIRKKTSADERAKYPTLTKTGAKLLEKVLPQVEKVDREFFSRLKKQTKDFNHLLSKLSYD
jgi:DNA-binding MarR family transcriptional regulator